MNCFSVWTAGWLDDDGMCDPILQTYQDGQCVPKCYFEDEDDIVSNYGCSLVTSMERCGDQLMEECPMGMIRTSDCSCVCERGSFPIFSVDNIVISSELLGDFPNNYYPSSTKYAQKCPFFISLSISTLICDVGLHYIAFQGSWNSKDSFPQRI